MSFFPTPTTTASFGVSAASTPLFGGAPNANVTQRISFGMPTNTQGLTFGIPSTTQAFGTTTTPQGSTLGAPISQGLCGAPVAATTQGLTFGAPATIQGLTFGTPAITQGLTFGAPATTQMTFGTPATTQGLTFGTPTTSSQGIFGFIATTSTPSMFGASTTSTTLFGSGVSSTGVTSSLFGSAVTSAPSLFGSVAPSMPKTTSSLFGSTAAPTFSMSAVTTISSTFKGLGGVDYTVTSAAATAKTVVSVKDQALPNELRQTVETLKNFMKYQRSLSGEIARSSAESLVKVEKKVNDLHSAILMLKGLMEKQKTSLASLRVETDKVYSHYQLCIKVKNAPLNSSDRALDLRKYFEEQVALFEQANRNVTRNLELLEQRVMAVHNSCGEDQLKTMTLQLHDIFLALCTTIYKIHNKVQILKVRFLTEYKAVGPLPTFESSRILELARDECGLFSQLEGPTPFSSHANASIFANVSSNLHSSFDSALTSLSTPASISLQKPPLLGGKRGKRL